MKVATLKQIIRAEIMHAEHETVENAVALQHAWAQAEQEANEIRRKVLEAVDGAGSDVNDRTRAAIVELLKDELL